MKKVLCLMKKLLSSWVFETPESALGEVIYFWGNNYKIVGVLKNFHQESLKENFDALIFRLTPGARDYFSIKLNYMGQAGTDSFKMTRETIGKIKDNWEQFFPGNPFDFFFLSNYYDNQYHAEKQFRTIFELVCDPRNSYCMSGLVRTFLVHYNTKDKRNWDAQS